MAVWMDTAVFSSDIMSKSLSQFKSKLTYIAVNINFFCDPNSESWVNTKLNAHKNTMYASLN